MYKMQEKILTQTSANFNIDIALKELRRDMYMFGAPTKHRAVV